MKLETLYGAAVVYIIFLVFPMTHDITWGLTVKLFSTVLGFFA